MAFVNGAAECGAPMVDLTQPGYSEDNPIDLTHDDLIDLTKEEESWDIPPEPQPRRFSKPAVSSFCCILFIFNI